MIYNGLNVTISVLRLIELNFILRFILLYLIMKYQKFFNIFQSYYVYFYILVF